MMELLDTDDPIKSELLMKTARHREDLEEETRAVAERTEKIITTAIVIGGALALTYFLYTQLSGSKKKKVKKKKETEVEVEDEVEETSGSSAGNILSQVGTALVSQGGVLLLALAKEKLTEYLRAQADKDKQS
jgi:flagellar basal body-associated protein FliL